MQAITLHDNTNCFSGLNSQQISLFLCEHNVLLSTSMSDASSLVASVREKIKVPDSSLRSRESSYLLYSIINNILHGMQEPLDCFADSLGDLEREIISNPERRFVRNVHFVKRELGLMRRQAWPTRELLMAVQNSTTPLIMPEARDYYRSLYDTSVQLIDLIETYRDVGTGLLELFTTRMSSQMSRIVRYLTILQVYFLPCIFFTGVLGKAPVNTYSFHSE